MAPRLLWLLGMADADLPQEPRAGAILHQFTVNRGMTLVLVIETTFWYSGLLQAALARVTLEGQN